MKAASSAPMAPVAPFISARKAADEARPETFAILGRVAACLWFTLLTLFYAQPLAAMVHAIHPGDHAFADWAPVVSRVCTLAFFLVQAWLMLARRSPVARAEGLSPVTISLLGTYGVWVIAFLPQATASPAITLLSAAITLLGSLMIILAIAFLGRSFSIAPQARTLGRAPLAPAARRAMLLLLRKKSKGATNRPSRPGAMFGWPTPSAGEWPSFAPTRST